MELDIKTISKGIALIGAITTIVRRTQLIQKEQKRIKQENAILTEVVES